MITAEYLSRKALCHSVRDAAVLQSWQRLVLRKQCSDWALTRQHLIPSRRRISRCPPDFPCRQKVRRKSVVLCADVQGKKDGEWQNHESAEQQCCEQNTAPRYHRPGHQ